MSTELTCPECGTFNRAGDQCRECGIFYRDAFRATCRECGTRNPVGVRCRECGVGYSSIQVASETASLVSRAIAAVLDGLIVYAIALGLSFLFVFGFRLGPGIALFVFIVTPWLYFAGGESSRQQGTLGKQMMGIAVVDDLGQGIDFWHASGRYLAKIPSGILLIGYFMAAFRSDRRALHDLMAGTYVTGRTPV